MRFFHRDGHIYEIETAEPSREISLLSRFLANTIYNPSIRFSYRYRQLQKYDLAELKRAVQSALAHDDDVLTQFASKEELLGFLVARNPSTLSPISSGRARVRGVLPNQSLERPGLDGLGRFAG